MSTIRNKKYRELSLLFFFKHAIKCKPDTYSPNIKIINKIRVWFHSREEKKLEILKKTYAKIPKLDCIENCGSACCGLIPLSKIEEKHIKHFLKINNLNVKYHNYSLSKTHSEALKGHMCFFLDNNKKCLIYSVRPLICRLFGVAENMKCPNVKPNKYLSENEANKLIIKINRL